MGLSHRVFLKEFLFVQSQTVTIHMEMWKNMVFSLEKNQLLYELKITTTYLKSSLYFWKPKIHVWPKKKNLNYGNWKYSKSLILI